MAIVVKSRDEIAIMKEAGRIVSGVRDLLIDSLRPGMVELELDEIARREFKKAGVCDKCGSELTQRSDDKPDVVRNRLKVNIGNMQPLVDHYAGQDKLTTVDGSRDPEAVSADLRKALEG